MMKYFNEFLGTFFLSLAIVASLLTGYLGVLQPLGIGTLLVGLIYADRKISGAHFNPAVTIGIWLRGRCPAYLIAPYIFVQLLAGSLAALLCHLLINDKRIKEPIDMSIGLGCLSEIIGTFILVYVILFVATAKLTMGNTYYGLAIGYTVTFCAYCFGGFGSLGCFNPAVALATYLSGLNTLQNLILISISNFIGGTLAALVFWKIEFKEQKKKTINL